MLFCYMIANAKATSREGIQHGVKEFDNAIQLILDKEPTIES